MKAWIKVKDDWVPLADKNREDMALQILCALIQSPRQWYASLPTIAVNMTNELIRELRETPSECPAPTKS